MTRRVVLAAAVVITSLISSASGSALASYQMPASPAQTPAGNADNGKRLFTSQTCYFCHGTVGQGTVAGTRLALPSRNAAGFIRYVRRPSGQMPAFTETMLSDQALTDIYTYLRSLPPAKSPKEIPLLNQLKGR